jgi:hypothetical protein
MNIDIAFNITKKISQHSHTEYWFIPTQFTSLQNVHQKDVGLQHAHIIPSHRTMNSPSNILTHPSPSQITNCKHVEILQQWKAHEFQAIFK